MRVLPVLVIGDKGLSGFNPKAIDAPSPADGYEQFVVREESALY